MVFQGDKILYSSKTSDLNESLDHFLFYNSDNSFYIMNISKRLKMRATVDNDLDIFLTGVYQADAGYIAGRMDNYYDANGLSDYEVVPDSLGSFIIRTYWNKEPSRREFNNNVQRWVEERKKWKKENNK